MGSSSLPSYRIFHPGHVLGGSPCPSWSHFASVSKCMALLLPLIFGLSKGQIPQGPLVPDWYPGVNVLSPSLLISLSPGPLPAGYSVTESDIITTAPVGTSPSPRSPATPLPLLQRQELPGGFALSSSASFQQEVNSRTLVRSAMLLGPPPPRSRQLPCAGEGQGRGCPCGSHPFVYWPRMCLEVVALPAFPWLHSFLHPSCPAISTPSAYKDTANLTLLSLHSRHPNS